MYLINKFHKSKIKSKIKINHFIKFHFYRKSTKMCVVFIYKDADMKEQDNQSLEKTFNDTIYTRAVGAQCSRPPGFTTAGAAWAVLSGEK